VFSGSGDAYVAEAVRSARSSLRHNHLPHLLFTSGEAEPVEGLSVARFEPSGHPYADKIANMRRSPFERTLYLDSDTFVVDALDDVFGVLDRYDIAVAYTAEGRGPHDPAVPGAFFELNTGVLAWRANERTAAFMRSWEETYLAWMRDGDPFPVQGAGSRGGRADQLAFRRCAWEQDVHLFVLAPEYNFRIGYPTTVQDRVRVLHGRHPDPEGLAERVNRTRLPRSWPPPLSPKDKVMRRVRKAAARGPRRQAPG
jgi:hypothetical protein